MKITVAGQELTFALEGKNTLTVSNQCGGDWEVRFCNDIVVGQNVYLGAKRRVPRESPYHYPASLLADKILKNFEGQLSILGSQLREFLDDFSSIKLAQAA